MSTDKNEKIERRGGPGRNQGRKKGSGKKTKICLSVTEKTWDAAKKKWKKKPSWLVDGLLLHYMTTGGSILKMEAAI
jgi:hypothetical protein